MRTDTTLRTAALALAAGLLTAVPSLAQDGSGIHVTVNRRTVDFTGQGPIESGGRVLVPLRGVLEKMGAYVSYDSARREVRAVRNETQIRLPIGSRTARVAGRSVPLDVPARIVNGSTMVPLRFVAEALGARVDYQAATSTVAIRSDGGYGGGGGFTPRPNPPLPANPGRVMRGTVIAVRARQNQLIVRDDNGERRTVRLDPAVRVRRRTPGADEPLELRRLLPGDPVALEMRRGTASTVTLLPARAADRL